MKRHLSCRLRFAGAIDNLINEKGLTIIIIANIMGQMAIINDITYSIRGSIFDVYNKLGPGLLESVYEEALVYELLKKGHKVDRQLEVPILYDGHKLSTDLRLDLLVDDSVIVELKSVDELHPVHFKQLRTYLKLMGKSVGLLINFNCANIQNGIKRLEE